MSEGVRHEQFFFTFQTLCFCLSFSHCSPQNLCFICRLFVLIVSILRILLSREPSLIPHTDTQLMILVLYEYLNQVWRCFNSSVYYYKCVRRLNCEFLVLLNRGTEPHLFMTASQTIITVSVIVLPIMLDKLNLNTLYWDCNLLLCSLLYILNVGQLADLFFILGCNFL